MTKSILGLMVILPIALACEVNAVASTVMLSASDSGFFNEAGRSSKNDGIVLGASPATFNYSVGAIDEVSPLAGTDVPRSNYFSFDLGSITDTILSAELLLYNPAGGYGSPDDSELFELYGAFADPPPSGSMAALASDLEAVYSILDPGELGSAMMLYTEITGGPGPLGAVEVSAADDDTTVSVPFSPLGVDFLNVFKGGPVVMGGSLATLDSVDAGDEFVFGFSAPLISGVLPMDPPIMFPTATPVLVVTTIPEPSTFTWILAMGVVPICRRKARSVGS